MNDRPTNRITPITLCLIGACVALFAASVWAQAPASNPDLARAQQMLSQEQSKVADLEQDLLALDSEIDADVNQLVDLLKKSEDSTASKTKVMNTKKETIASLDKWVKEYTRERGKRMGDLQQTRSPSAQAELQHQVESIDDGINRRVDQMVELAASMSTSEELKRYDTYQQDWGLAKVEREDYKVNKRQISYANQAQEELGKKLEQTIKTLENDIALVPQRFPRDQQEAELARLNSLLDARNNDLRKLATAYPEKANAVGKNDADRLEKQLHYTQEDIRAKWAQLLAKANTLSVERLRVRQLEARVKAMEAEAAPVPAAPEAP
jgi:hypothetical protein